MPRPCIRTWSATWLLLIAISGSAQSDHSFRGYLAGTNTGCAFDTTRIKGDQWPAGTRFQLERMIERDRRGGGNNELENRTNLDTLNLIIARAGWPPSFLFSDGGMGAAIVLAHQPWFGSAEFDHYFELVAAKCNTGEECWQTGLFILEQRIRRLARTSDDTLLIVPGEAANDRIEAMWFAVARRLVTNGTKKLHLRCRSVEDGHTAMGRIMETQPPIEISEQTVQWLIANHYDHPAPITSERIDVLIDPDVTEHQMLFRMD